MLCIDMSKIGLIFFCSFVYFSVDGQNLCASDSCKKKKQIVVPIVASVSSAVVVLIALTVIWKLRKERKSSNVTC